MKYLLDTNVVSELRKVGDGVGAQDSNDLFISAITILELECGILGIQRRDADQGSRLRRWMKAGFAYQKQLAGLRFRQVLLATSPVLVELIAARLIVYS